MESPKFRLVTRPRSACHCNQEAVGSCEKTLANIGIIKRMSTRVLLALWMQLRLRHPAWHSHNSTYNSTQFSHSTYLVDQWFSQHINSPHPCVTNLLAQSITASSLCSHSINLRLDIRKYTFSQKVVNDWNKLPEECINATSVNMFKNRIDQYLLKTRRE